MPIKSLTQQLILFVDKWGCRLVFITAILLIIATAVLQSRGITDMWYYMKKPQPVKGNIWMNYIAAAMMLAASWRRTFRK